ncbi:hypothetical protein BJX70DRAFT_376486, partial [Aspergillus crustosus]
MTKYGDPVSTVISIYAFDYLTLNIPSLVMTDHDAGIDFPLRSKNFLVTVC